jgi:hypothetical protein
MLSEGIVLDLFESGLLVVSVVLLVFVSDFSLSKLKLCWVKGGVAHAIAKKLNSTADISFEASDSQ